MQRADCEAKVVRPEQDREHALPEYEVQVTDGEQPSGSSECARPTVLLDPDSFHGVTSASPYGLPSLDGSHTGDERNGYAVA